MYEYKCKINRIIDGDTVDVDIDLGFGIWMKDERVRIMGIDTPESRTRDKIEKIFGIAAKERLQELLGKECTLQTQINKDGEDMKGKFGRILGDFIVNDKSVAETLVEEHHAVKYFGQNKADVASSHISNRNMLMHENKVDINEIQQASDKIK